MSASHSPRVLFRVSIPFFFALLLILITAVGLPAAPASAPPPIDQRHPTAPLTGWFNILWADGEPGTHCTMKNTGLPKIAER